MKAKSDTKGPGQRIGSYQLGKELGKGGFGTVYQGLDTATGRFVAVKQVSTKNVPGDELESIHSEINLLKKLKHDNIVRYFDSIEVDGTLNIVLEFVENGSLSDILKRFGTFTESLAVLYISQVLRGLEYLHIQGVIHRDIKGANILTTKNGLVKLADFGVALDSKDGNNEEGVVGTPYWMAPEIIEMAGPTSKCDIWSVGCVVIELLTGEPPYYHLAPLAALFHIAQDANGPKIPGGVSSVLRDFLRKCFHKQPEFRKGADELLDHPWLRVKRENVEVEATLRRHGMSNSDESSVLQMQELKQSIQATLRRNVTFTRRRKVGVGSNKTVEDEKNAQSVDDSLNSNRHQYQQNETTVDLSAFDIDDSSSRDSDGDSSSDWDQDMSLIQKNNVSQSSALGGKSNSLVHIVKEDEISNDFWDDEDTMEKIREMKESIKPAETSSLKNTTDIILNDKEENVQSHIIGNLRMYINHNNILTPRL